MRRPDGVRPVLSETRSLADDPDVGQGGSRTSGTRPRRRSNPATTPCSSVEASDMTPVCHLHAWGSRCETVPGSQRFG